MKKYTCIFPGLYNYILTKDVGMIPYTLSDDFESSIVTYNNDEYIYLDNLLKKDNFNIKFLKNTGNEKKDVVDYIKSNAKNIDILQLYHLNYGLLPWYVYTYKHYNPKGKVYLKLDSNNELIDFLIERRNLTAKIRRLFVKIIFKKVDLISIETKRNFNKLKRLIPEEKLIYLPNGIVKTDTPLNKEKIILYVGNIEKSNKSIDLLLNSIKEVKLKDWKVVLIGKIEKDMKEFIENFRRENPQLENKIVYKGYISDKKELSTEYAKSSIYCCSSHRESFGISILEACYYGNYLISTNVGGSPDIIQETDYGQIIKHDTPEFTKTIQDCINNWDMIKQDPYLIQEKILKKYEWKKICQKIIEKID